KVFTGEKFRRSVLPVALEFRDGGSRHAPRHPEISQIAWTGPRSKPKCEEGPLCAGQSGPSNAL
ncbi:MAG: hypothetical protein AB7F09_13385, partial [Parvibaculaceae bacterium]